MWPAGIWLFYTMNEILHLAMASTIEKLAWMKKLSAQEIASLTVDLVESFFVVIEKQDEIAQKKINSQNKSSFLHWFLLLTAL